MSIRSRKIAGRHYEYVCSKCYKVIDPLYIFDSVCPTCGEKIRANEGDSATCLGQIAHGCISNCKHSKSHTKRSSDCHMFHCKAVGRMVSCVYNGGPCKSD